VLFVVDVSASGVFGSGDRAKLEMIVEVAALLMFSALKNNDKVGLLTFCDQPLEFHPPRKGKANVLRLIRELLAVQPLARPTHLDSALQFLNRVQKRRAVVFLMSDFLMELPKDALAITNSRHELIAISVTDPREHALPRLGILTLEDPETGERVRIDTRSRRVRDQFARWASEREAKKSTTFKRLGIDELSLRTHPDTPASAAASELIMPQYVAQLRRFLVARQVRTGR
jgi:uncharacterized protein (DUF58 family)